MASTRPSYLRAYKEGRLRALKQDLYEQLSKCRLCPQNCGTDRSRSKKGICKTGVKARVSSYAPHFGEEPQLVGRNGSGTIFFTHCNLLCNFCQNYDISHEGVGQDVEVGDMAAMMLYLQISGCHNINFVTPSHVVPQIIGALEIAIEQGLSVPLVYNTSGYDTVETLRLLEGIIDIYMPDFKFLDARAARNTCRSDNYPEVAKAAIKEMYRQVGNLKTDDSGVAYRGLLIRHLIMPGAIEDSRNIIRYIVSEISPEAFVNIMPQYRPCGEVAETPRFDRPLLQAEYDEVLSIAEEEGLVNVI